MKVVFFGTPPFAAQVLDFLLQNQVQVVAVISKPDRPKGRSGLAVPTAVKLVAEAHQPSLPAFQPEFVSALAFVETLKAYDADLFIVVAYGEIMKQYLLDIPSMACINLHASLLPKYRGAAPIQRSIIEGNKETGVTIMHMVKKMDAGDMIKKVTVAIEPEMTYGKLEQALCTVGKQALLEVIRQFERGETLREPQDHSLMTLAPKIELEDCEVLWSESAQRLHDLVRGVNPHPGAWCYIHLRGEKKRLKIAQTRIIEHACSTPGTILNLHQNKGNLLIAAKDHALELIDVQLEGKKLMTSEKLTRGISRSLFSFIETT